MPRVKGGTVTRRRRKKVLKLAKGYFGSKHTLCMLSETVVKQNVTSEDYGSFVLMQLQD